jgi:hypothetical protein
MSCEGHAGAGRDVGPLGVVREWGVGRDEGEARLVFVLVHESAVRLQPAASDGTANWALWIVLVVAVAADPRLGVGSLAAVAEDVVVEWAALAGWGPTLDAFSGIVAGVAYVLGAVAGRCCSGENCVR